MSVPDRGVATYDENLPEAANKAWIYGHSRWLGSNGLFFKLQDINVGDDVFIDGIDRDTNERYTDLRFRVSHIFVVDNDNGSDLLTARTPEQAPMRPIVMLQTSVRENGAGKQWILDRDKVLAKATLLVDGDLNDTCKYLNLFVVAEPTWSP